MDTEREAMTLERKAFVQWLETLQPSIPTTVEVECAWRGYQAAWQYVREKTDFAARMTERIAANLPRATEPVACGLFTNDGLIRMWSKKWFGEVGGKSVDPTPLYTSPPERAPDAKDAEIAHLREVLGDLLSWFPAKPSSPEWRLEAGDHGADEAVEAARAAMAQEQ